jgi:thiamine-phosphate pyrophosphorylase
VSPRLILITDPRYPAAHLERVIRAAAEVLPPGALAVQLRDKRPNELARTASILAPVIAESGALLVINGSLDVARAVGARAVHVPCDAASIGAAREAHGWVSTPTHTDADVSVAADAGASAVLVSPIFETPGKGAPRGVAALVAARERARLTRVYALGGVDVSRAAPCARAGAAGIAVIRALLDAPDPGSVARSLVDGLDGV